MLASSVRNVNPILPEVSESRTSIPQAPTSQPTQSNPDSLSSPKKEPRFEISLNWFDQWNFSWSCTEAAWKQFSEKLQSPLTKGLAVGTGIVIGVGVSVYVYVQVNKALNPAERSPLIEAPAPKK